MVAAWSASPSPRRRLRLSTASRAVARRACETNFSTNTSLELARRRQFIGIDIDADDTALADAIRATAERTLSPATFRSEGVSFRQPGAIYRARRWLSRPFARRRAPGTRSRPLEARRSRSRPIKRARDGLYFGDPSATFAKQPPPLRLIYTICRTSLGVRLDCCRDAALRRLRRMPIDR